MVHAVTSKSRKYSYDFNEFMNACLFFKTTKWIMHSFVLILGTFYTVHNSTLLQTLSLIYRHIASIYKLGSRSHPKIFWQAKIFFKKHLKKLKSLIKRGNVTCKVIYQLCSKFDFSSYHYQWHQFSYSHRKLELLVCQISPSSSCCYVFHIQEAETTHKSVQE